jgi:hypothetical protein
VTDVDYLCRTNPEFLQNGSRFFEFGRRTLTLERQELTIRPQQRQCPPGQAGERRDGARGHHVRGVLTGDLLGARSPDHDVRQPEEVHTLLKKDGTPQERLQQRDRQIRTHDRENDAGQTGTRADIDELSRLRDQFGDHGAVEDMPVPQALDLSGTDESALHTRAGQELGVPRGQGERVAEDLMGLRRCRK